MSDAREKTIRWADPVATADSVKNMSGLASLQAMLTGELPPPPIVELMAIRMLSAEDGKVRMSLTPDESHYNPLGTVHGGAIATLLDSVMGCAVQSTLPEGRGYTTVHLGINYIRPLTVGTGEVFGEGTVVHAGRSTAIANGRVVDREGTLYATGDTTCLILQPERDDKA